MAPSNEEYRREFEELEQLDAGAVRHQPTVVFSSEAEADSFALYLRKEAEIDASAVVARGGDRMRYWDINVPVGKGFALEMLYRLYSDGVRLEELPRLPPTTRTHALTQLLLSRAIRSDRWRGKPCTDADLTWYRDAARLSSAQIDRAVAAAETEFFEQHSSEKGLAVWLGGGAIILAVILGIMLGWTSPATLLAGGAGVAFLLFSATRQHR